MKIKLAPVVCTLDVSALLSGELFQVYRRAKARLGEGLGPLIVVNQSGEQSPADTLEALFFSQGNFGGAGGFTRGIIEAEQLGATHFLLMDDDAVPDDNSIPKVVEYYTKNPDVQVALHGTMFSQKSPNTVHESGARLVLPLEKNFHIVRRLAGHKVTSENIADDSVLNTDMEIDYGAWWFFACPMVAMKKVGLPLPLFIRGDDREYGVRLKAAGIRTIPLPGLRVWHPEHDDKLHTWYLYFAWRNNFVERAIYCDASSLMLAFGFTKKVFYRFLSFQYDAMDYILCGCESYLRGPKAIKENPKNEIEFAKSVISHWPISFVPADAPPVENDSIMPFVTEKIKQSEKKNDTLWIIVLNGLLFPIKRKLIPVFLPHALDWFPLRNCRKYGLYSALEKRIKLYTLRLSAIVRMFCKAIYVFLHFILKNPSVRKQWKAAFPELTSHAFWRNYLAIDNNCINKNHSQ
jgi:galactofuranosylgalactofuranosylrhamnosyl-N-acetylglucosaminyl-diphospho-decaprenol beta-1,5/1,6-galactofuranosyltransferase